jgi:Arabinose-binding domain of AraC transcription regulator, N-term
MSNGTASALNLEQDLASIPMAQGGLARLAIARLKSAGVTVAPLLKRVGLTPELVAEPKERLSVRSQIALLDEAAIALKDDCIGFTLARDFDLREIGLLYYVMASSQTLGDALTGDNASVRSSLRSRHPQRRRSSGWNCAKLSFRGCVPSGSIRLKCCSQSPASKHCSTKIPCWRARSRTAFPTSIRSTMYRSNC